MTWIPRTSKGGAIRYEHPRQMLSLNRATRNTDPFQPIAEIIGGRLRQRNPTATVILLATGNEMLRVFVTTPTTTFTIKSRLQESTSCNQSDMVFHLITQNLPH